MDKIWKRGHWQLIADRSQVFPEDPGAGTPLLVMSPTGTSGTLHCVLDTGEIGCGDESVPASVLSWLARVQDEAEAWVYADVPA